MKKVENDKEKGWRLMWCLHPEQVPGKRRRFLIGESKYDRNSGEKLLRGVCGVSKTLKVTTEVPKGSWKVSENKEKGTMKCIVPEGGLIKTFSVESGTWTNPVLSTKKKIIKVMHDSSLANDYDINVKNCLNILRAGKEQDAQPNKDEEEELD